MAFDFMDLTPEARRAAFAHMDGKGKGKRRLGSGARHRAMTAESKKASPAKPTPRAAEASREPVFTGPSHPTGELSQSYLRGGKPTPEDHGILARRYLQMHGSAGVRTRIAQLRARKRLSSKDQAQLAALRALR
ncbi:hypothetical protein [Amycolatopsis plumensis]|uniref:Lsr2 protein n=1 Tax=Amycolatopsis plumensis TaxID=236508 RepID=A0ABV5U8H9_9PSEU